MVEKFWVCKNIFCKTQLNPFPTNPHPPKQCCLLVLFKVPCAIILKGNRALSWKRDLKWSYNDRSWDVWIIFQFFQKVSIIAKSSQRIIEVVYECLFFHLVIITHLECTLYLLDPQQLPTNSQIEMCRTKERKYGIFFPTIMGFLCVTQSQTFTPVGR